MHFVHIYKLNFFYWGSCECCFSVSGSSMQHNNNVKTIVSCLIIISNNLVHYVSFLKILLVIYTVCKYRKYLVDGVSNNLFFLIFYRNMFLETNVNIVRKNFI